MSEPAFPTGIITDGKGKIIGGSNGMTLRDYFAAKAIIAYHSDGGFTNFENAAIWCYAMADAMLKARTE